jgi:hypothetical protein
MTKVTNFIRRSFTVLGTIVFTVLVLAALTPQAGRGVATALAQAASLVQVANTSATPVPVEDPGQQGVTLVALGPKVAFSNWSSPGTTYSVPYERRLVVEDISGTFNTPAGAHISQSYVTVTRNVYAFLQSDVHRHIAPQLVTEGNYNIYKFSEKAWFYVDSPGTVSLNIITTGGDPVTGVEVVLQGHLVDCTGTNCPGLTSPAVPQSDSGSPPTRPAPLPSPPK